MSVKNTFGSLTFLSKVQIPIEKMSINCLWEMDDDLKKNYAPRHKKKKAILSEKAKKQGR